MTGQPGGTACSLDFGHPRRVGGKGCVEGRAEGAISPLELVTDRDVEPIDAGHLGIDGTKGTHDVAVQPGPIVHRT